MSDHTDAALVQRVLDTGGATAFGELVRRYQGRVYGLAYAILGDWAEAQDMAQETFMRAYVRLGALRDHARFPAWLRRIAFNTCMDWLKSFRPELYRSLGAPADIGELDLADTRLASPPIAAERNEMSRIVVEAVSQLPAKYRIPLTLCHLDGLSHKRVAEFLEVPPGTAKSLVHYARKMLKPALEAVAPEVSPMVDDVFHQHKLPDEFGRQLDRFVEAANRGDLEAVQAMLDGEPRLAGAGRKDKDGQMQRQPALFRAAAMGRLDVIEFLVQRGADINALWREDYGTPLVAACECLNSAGARTVRRLLELGADPNRSADASAYGLATPLRMAMGTYARSPEKHAVVESLLAAGANHSCSEAVMAIHRGRVDLLEDQLAQTTESLHQLYDEVDYRYGPFNRGGPGLLHIAADYNEIEFAAMLLDRGADVNARAAVDDHGIGGQTPIVHTAASWTGDESKGYCLPSLQLLIERRADLEARAVIRFDTQGASSCKGQTLELTPLGYAMKFHDGPSWRNSRAAVDLLRRHGATE